MTLLTLSQVSNRFPFPFHSRSTYGPFPFHLPFYPRLQSLSSPCQDLIITFPSASHPLIYSSKKRRVALSLCRYSIFVFVFGSFWTNLIHCSCCLLLIVVDPKFPLSFLTFLSLFVNFLPVSFVSIVSLPTPLIHPKHGNYTLTTRGFVLIFAYSHLSFWIILGYFGPIQSIVMFLTVFVF